MSKINPALYSSDRQDWMTPPEFITALLAFLSMKQFDLDCFCTKENVAARHHLKGLFLSPMLWVNLSVTDFVAFAMAINGFGISWSLFLQLVTVGSIAHPSRHAQPSKFTVFLNPPYGPDLKPAMQKCSDEAKRGLKIWALVPARTETHYQHDHGLADADFTVFLRGRLSFLRDGEKVGSAPFPTMLLYWGHDWEDVALRWAENPPMQGTVMTRVRRTTQMGLLA